MKQGWETGLGRSGLELPACSQGSLQPLLIEPTPAGVQKERLKGQATSRGDTFPRGTDRTVGIHRGERGLPRARAWGGPYLLGGCVFDCVGVVIIIYDIQILHRVTGKRAAELHVQWGFSGPLGVDGEVGWFPIFHTWKDEPGSEETGLARVVSFLEPV